MATKKSSALPKFSSAYSGPPRIEYVATGVLRPNPKNARTHSRKQIRKIAASLRKFGFLSPILTDDDNMILAGHGRLEAARLAGLDQVPIVRCGHLTPAQKRAYLIADNKLAEQAGWNREMLAIELGELIDLLPTEGIDVALTGFETAEIDLLLADMAASRSEPEDIQPALPAKPDNAPRRYVAPRKTPAVMRRCAGRRRFWPSDERANGFSGILRPALQSKGQRHRRARARSTS